MIKLVSFDLDDTLYNEKNFVLGGFSEVCTYLAGKYNTDYYILYREIQNILLQKGRGEVFNLLCEAYDFDEEISELVNIYRKAKPNLKLYEDSIFVLSELKQKYKLGLITDGLAMVQWNKIKLLKIEQYFDKIIVTDDIGRDFWKPNEFAYSEILRYFNINASEAVYVGDNPNKDFIGAKKVGMKTVRIIRKSGDHIGTRLAAEYEADYEIAGMKKLLDVLKGVD